MQQDAPKGSTPITGKAGRERGRQIKEEKEMDMGEGGTGRTTPNFSTETRPRPEPRPAPRPKVETVEAATPGGTTVQSDAQGHIEIHPPAVGNERTLQLAIICLTLIAVCVVLVDAYTAGGGVETIVVPIIAGIAGLLGGQALRK